MVKVILLGINEVVALEYLKVSSFGVHRTFASTSYTIFGGCLAANYAARKVVIGQLRCLGKKLESTMINSLLEWVKGQRTKDFQHFDVLMLVMPACYTVDRPGTVVVDSREAIKLALCQRPCFNAK